MNQKPEAAKIRELRARTDRQLIALIEKELERGMSLDGVAAERAYREVMRLLPVAYGATPAERERIELKLALLGETFAEACAQVA